MVKRTTAAWICGIWIIAWWALYPRLGPVVKAFALSRMGSTADYFFTYMGPELLVFAFGLLVLPVLYLVALRRVAWWLQLLAIPALVAAFTVLVYYDVMKIAREAERLCTTQAGLRVYRTVEAEGIYGVSDIRYWSDYGFNWLEMDAGKDKYIRITFDGQKEHKQYVSAPSSSYEYRYLPHEAFSSYFERVRQVVVDRESREVLGEVIEFLIFPGRADRLVSFGLKFIPPVCSKNIPDVRGGQKYRAPFDLIKSTVKPRTG